MSSAHELPNESNSTRPMHDARWHIVRLVGVAQRQMLYHVLKTMSKSEIIDAMLEMNHLPDLLDYFNDHIRRYAAKQ